VVRVQYGALPYRFTADATLEILLVTTRQTMLDENGVSVSCEVRVFPLLVQRQSNVWPEFEQRTIQWVAPGKALTLVREPELKALVAAFTKRTAISKDMA
jgi:hypothetical protein